MAGHFRSFSDNCDVVWVYCCILAGIRGIAGPELGVGRCRATASASPRACVTDPTPTWVVFAPRMPLVDKHRVMRTPQAGTRGSRVGGGGSPVSSDSLKRHRALGLFWCEVSTQQYSVCWRYLESLRGSQVFFSDLSAMRGLSLLPAGAATTNLGAAIRRR